MHTLPGSPSQALTRQLSQRESPWQSTQTSSLCQGLSLWERWHRAAMTERARTLAGVFPKIFPPLQSFPPLNRMQYGKGVGILSGGRGEEQRQTAGFWAAKLCVLLILTELSQKIRRPAIESTRLACIIGMLGTHCPQRGRNCCAGRCGRETVG